MRQDKQWSSAGSAAADISLLLEREVNLIEDVRKMSPRDDAFIDSYEMRGIACRLNEDGSLDVAVKPDRVSLRNMLYAAVYSICSIKGPEGILRSGHLMDEALRRTGMPSAALKIMKDTDRRAAILACSNGDATDQDLARNILRVAFGWDDIPQTLERSVCDGFRTYRRAAIAEVRRMGDPDVVRNLARDTLSPFSSHMHVHLGRPVGALRALKYPDIPVIIDAASIRRISQHAARSVPRLIDEGLIDELRNPMCVITNAKKPDSLTLVLNIRDARGAFVTVNVAAPKSVDAEGLSIRLFHPRDIFPSGLAKLLMYEENIVYLRRSEATKYSADVLPVLKDIQKNGAPENAAPRKANDGDRVGLYQDDNTYVLNSITKVIEKFNNPKNFDELDKILAAAVAKSEARGIPSPSEAIKEEVHEEAVKESHGEEKKVEAAPAVKSPLVFRLAAPVERGRFSKATLKKLQAAGISNAAAVKSRLYGPGAEERFVADFGKKAFRDANLWLDDLGLREVQHTARQKIDATMSSDGKSLAVTDFFRAFKEFPDNVAPGLVAMPVGADGKVLSGIDAYQTAARVATNPRWQGCNMFFTKDDLATLGLSPTEAAEPVYMISHDGAPLWNLMDVDMSHEMKALISARCREAAPAVPSAILRQISTYTPEDRDDALSVAAHLDKTFLRMAAEAGTAAIEPFDTILKNESAAREKRVDPFGLLRGYGFQPADIHSLMISGEVAVKGEINRRFSFGYMADSGLVAKRKVDITLRIEDDSLCIYDSRGNRIPGKAKDIFEDPSRSLDTVKRKRIPTTKVLVKDYKKGGPDK